MWLRGLTKQQLFIAAGVLLVSILTLVSFLVSPEIPVYEAQPQQTQAEFDANLLKDRKAYEEYLKKINIDTEASRLLLAEIVNEEDVAKLVAEELNTSQPTPIPTVPDRELVLVATTQAGVENYSSEITRLNNELAQRTGSLSGNLYASNGIVLREMQGQITRHLGKISQLSVPGDAKQLHKSYVNIYRSMARQVGFATEYLESTNKPTFSAWYPELAISLDQSGVMRDEISRLSEKYNISFGNPSELSGLSEKLVQLGLVTEAKALFGEGFLVEMAMDAVGAAVSVLFNGLMTKLVGLIEKNFIIANFLQYADALVAAKYSTDYLDKYVEDSIDKEMIKSFIPQFSCGFIDSAQVKQLANFRAREFLGFDPLDINPEDPNFSQNLLKLGSGLAFEDGQISYAKASAAMTEFQAKFAANQEIVSPGKKTAISQSAAAGAAIQGSLSLIENTQLAALISQVGSGAANFRSINPFVSQLVHSIVENLINSFVFRSATFTIKEQTRDLCLKGASAFANLLPAEGVGDAPNIPPPPTVDELRRCEAVPTSANCEFLRNYEE